jgi:alkylhydroperoxidase family enzyme
MRDAGKLNKGPGVMIEEEVLAVRCEGASDEEILEVNQASACFNFSKQTL